MTKNDIDKLATLNYTYGKLTALKQLPGPTQTMTFYAMECDHPDLLPCSENENASYGWSQIYMDDLEIRMSKINDEIHELYDRLKGEDEALFRHLNTLHMAFGYARIMQHTLQDLTLHLRDMFIENGADDRGLIIGKIMSIYDNMDYQLVKFSDLVTDLKNKAQKKLKKAGGGK